jgi:O-methyltransferase involved in polyketide biosynthesis
MTAFDRDFVSADADQAAYRTALDCARARAQHSYFNQHIISDPEAGYLAIDEGDYCSLSTELAGRVIETVRGQLLDEY